MFCGQCGLSNAESDDFCRGCGAPLIPSSAGTGVVAEFAGFWIRVGAYLIDYFLLLAVMCAAVAATIAIPQGQWMVSLIYVVMGFVAPWLYTALMESSASQATVGKLACGLRVADMSGQRIGFGRATGRYFAEWVTGFTLGVGYLMVLFTSKRQTLHDKIAGTVVVLGKPEPAAIVSAPAAKPAHPALIVVAILGTSVPLIGIVAAIAIPAYHDYTVRAQVVEGLVLAARAKAAVADYVDTNDEWPADLDAIGMREEFQTAANSSRYVESMNLSNGTITITYGSAANARIRGARLSLQPFATEDGDIMWQCGNSEIEGIELSGSDAGRTDIDDKFLPVACRSPSASR